MIPIDFGVEKSRSWVFSIESSQRLSMSIHMVSVFRVKMSKVMGVLVIENGFRALTDYVIAYDET